MITSEQYEACSSICTCKKCHSLFKPDKYEWCEQGMYSEKITKCPECGCINVVKYQDGFNQNPNFDERYYR